MLTSPRTIAAHTGKRLRACLCLLLLGFAGCAPALQDPAPAAPPAADSPPLTLAEKIAITSRELEQTFDPALRAELLLTLALLQTHPDNPAPDYARALHCLQRYAQYDPQAAGSESIRRLTALLAAVTAKTDRAAQLAAENHHLAAECRALEQKTRELERSNRSMKAVIEKLKNLDIRLERRRNRLE